MRAPPLVYIALHAAHAALCAPSALAPPSPPLLAHVVLCLLSALPLLGVLFARVPRLPVLCVFLFCLLHLLSLLLPVPSTLSTFFLLPLVSLPLPLLLRVNPAFRSLRSYFPSPILLFPSPAMATPHTHAPALLAIHLHVLMLVADLLPHCLSITPLTRGAFRTALKIAVATPVAVACARILVGHVDADRVRDIREQMERVNNLKGVVEVDRVRIWEYTIGALVVDVAVRVDNFDTERELRHLFKTKLNNCNVCLQVETARE